MLLLLWTCDVCTLNYIDRNAFSFRYTATKISPSYITAIIITRPVINQSLPVRAYLWKEQEDSSLRYNICWHGQQTTEAATTGRFAVVCYNIKLNVAHLHFLLLALSVSRQIYFFLRRWLSFRSTGVRAYTYMRTRDSLFLDGARCRAKNGAFPLYLFAPWVIGKHPSVAD